MLAWRRILNGDGEPQHSAHVTRLALELFDALHAAAGLTPAARGVLEAACALHDAAFALCPAHHARAAAALVLREGIPGLTPLEQRMAAAAIRLHSGNWRAELACLPSSRLRPAHLAGALRMAAFLRVADGLDHSHLQDASLRTIRISPARITVAVRCGIYAGNALYANQKADLWNCFCAAPIVFRALGPAAHRPPFQGVLSPQDRADDAARRTLLFLYRLVADARQAVLAGCDPAALHDLRVAIRRHRTALRFFRPRLGAPSAHQVDRALAALQNRLSPHRDAEVYLRFLVEQRVDESTLRRLRTAATARRRRLTALLEEEATRSLLLRMAALARVETTARRRKSYAAFAARRVRRILQRVLAHGHVAPAASPEAAHAFRKLVRRARYYAEMASPALGGPVPRLASRLKALADALGDMHDADVLAAHVATSLAKDTVLRDTLRWQSHRARAGHLRVWQRLANRRACGKIMRCLRAEETSR